MPPFNAERRDRLADAAIEVLAHEGARAQGASLCPSIHLNPGKSP